MAAGLALPEPTQRTGGNCSKPSGGGRRLLEKEILDEKDLAELIGPPAGPPMRVAAE